MFSMRHNSRRVECVTISNLLLLMSMMIARFAPFVSVKWRPLLSLPVLLVLRPPVYPRV